MFEILFTGFFVLVFAYGMYEVWDIPILARIFPFWISLIAFALSLIQLAIEARRSFVSERTRGSEFADDVQGNNLERAIGIEPTTFSLGSRCS